MGYSTDFTGKFDLDKPLTDEHYEYLVRFSYTRRMLRDATLASKIPDPVRLAAGLPVGKGGGYFVAAKGFAGQEGDGSVTDHNHPPPGQPSLWCQWIPTEDRKSIEWDGGEKFYEYVKWICYIVDNFLKPWGYVLNGRVRWQGEDATDYGTIIVEDNEVRTA